MPGPAISNKTLISSLAKEYQTRKTLGTFEFNGSKAKVIDAKKPEKGYTKIDPVQVVKLIGNKEVKTYKGLKGSVLNLKEIYTSNDKRHWKVTLFFIRFYNRLFKGIGFKTNAEFIGEKLKIFDAPSNKKKGGEGNDSAPSEKSKVKGDSVPSEKSKAKDDKKAKLPVNSKIKTFSLKNKSDLKTFNGKSFPNLEKLTVEKAKIENFDNLKNLKELTLDNVSSDLIENLPKNDQLETLVITHTKDLSKLDFSKFPQLKNLTIEDLEVDKHYPQNLEDLSLLENLEKVVLAVSLSQEGTLKVSGVETLENLKSLNLEKIKLGAYGFSIDLPSSLEEFSINQCEFSAKLHFDSASSFSKIKISYPKLDGIFATGPFEIPEAKEVDLASASATFLKPASIQKLKIHGDYSSKVEVNGDQLGQMTELETLEMYHAKVQTEGNQPIFFERKLNHVEFLQNDFSQVVNFKRVANFEKLEILGCQFAEGTQLPRPPGATVNANKFIPAQEKSPLKEPKPFEPSKSFEPPKPFEPSKSFELPKPFEKVEDIKKGGEPSPVIKTELERMQETIEKEEAISKEDLKRFFPFKENENFDEKVALYDTREKMQWLCRQVEEYNSLGGGINREAFNTFLSSCSEEQKAVIPFDIFNFTKLALVDGIYSEGEILKDLFFKDKNFIPYLNTKEKILWLLERHASTRARHESSEFVFKLEKEQCGLLNTYESIKQAFKCIKGFEKYKIERAQDFYRKFSLDQIKWILEDYSFKFHESGIDKVKFEKQVEALTPIQIADLIIGKRDSGLKVLGKNEFWDDFRKKFIKNMTLDQLSGVNFARLQREMTKDNFSVLFKKVESHFIKRQKKEKLKKRLTSLLPYFDSKEKLLWFFEMKSKQDDKNLAFTLKYFTDAQIQMIPFASLKAKNINVLEMGFEFFFPGGVIGENLEKAKAKGEKFIPLLSNKFDVLMFFKQKLKEPVSNLFTCYFDQLTDDQISQTPFKEIQFPPAGNGMSTTDFASQLMGYKDGKISEDGKKRLGRILDPRNLNWLLAKADVYDHAFTYKSGSIVQAMLDVLTSDQIKDLVHDDRYTNKTKAILRNAKEK